MSVLLHLSDTHFGTEVPAVVAALLAAAHAIVPDLAVLSGDVTQRARRAQFSIAREFVSRLGCPCLTLPGNHDIPLFNVAARIFAPYAGFRRALGDVLEPSYGSTDLLVIAVNTTRARRHKHGEIDAQQIARVTDALHRAPPQCLRIVVTHQPALAIEPEDERNVLRGRDAALRAWVPAGLDLLLGGHIHLPYVRPVDVAGRDGARSAWVVQAGTAVSARVRGNVPNSFNVIRYEAATGEPHCRVERWDYDAQRCEFALAAAQLLGLSKS